MTKRNVKKLEWGDGSKEWYCDGVHHKIDGPALDHANGHKEWYVNGHLHRIDGPAVTYSDGQETWFVNDKKIDIAPILERLDISPDWENWTDEEKFLVRLAL